MTAKADDHHEDWVEVRRFLAGDTDVLGELRTRHQSYLMAYLLGKGASPTLAEDLLADLWNDSLGAGGLLERYSGRCPLRHWLRTVVLNRFKDQARREKFVEDVAGRQEDDGSGGFFERVAAPVMRAGETGLADLMVESLEQAFAECPAEQLLMLRLVYLHQVKQREVVRMVGWTDAKVSRTLSSAMETIRDRTLACLQKRDALLALDWEDFLELCEAQRVGFL